MKISASQFLQELQNLEIEKLQEVKGLGPIIIENLTTFVKSKNFEKLEKDNPSPAVQTLNFEFNIYINFLSYIYQVF